MKIQGVEYCLGGGRYQQYQIEKDKKTRSAISQLWKVHGSSLMVKTKEGYTIFLNESIDNDINEEVNAHV